MEVRDLACEEAISHLPVKDSLKPCLFFLKSFSLSELGILYLLRKIVSFIYTALSI